MDALTAEATIKVSPPETVAILLATNDIALAEQCLQMLRQAGFGPQAELAQTVHELRARLGARDYDIILAASPLAADAGFDLVELLEGLEKRIPIILIGAAPDAQAELDSSGRHVADLVYADRLGRLPGAVRRTLELKRLHQERQDFESHLRQLEATSQRLAEHPVNSLAAFVELNPNPVLEFSREGKLTYCNAAAHELARTSGAQAMAKLLPPEVEALVGRCLLDQEKLCVETNIGKRTLSWLFFPISQNQAVHCYVTDITERLSLERQLRHSQRLESVGRLAAGAAHDFNNILTVIQGHTGLLRSIPDLTPEMSQSVQQVSLAAQRATKLTGQLLAFSRNSILQPKRLDLNDALTNISAILYRTLGEDIGFQFCYDQDLPPIYADISLLEQVVMNLAVNARDAMPQGGQLVIQTDAVEIDPDYATQHPEARPGHFVCLTMTDTGCGMDLATLNRLFEPFFTTKELGKGTGLGLATVYGIVKQHRGWIEVQSQLGQGSTFKLYFPPCDGLAPSDPPSLARAIAPPGTETVLIVEDEAPVRLTARNILERYGYHILEAANGVEALAIWHQHHQDIALVLTDLVMPVGLNGQELAERFSTQKPGLKVIYTSGYSVDVAAKDLPASDRLRFLEKPFDAQRLACAVRESLDS